MSSDRSGDVGLALFLGFAVGAVTALLIAPGPGDDTRRRVGKAAQRLRGDFEGRIRDARGTMSQTAEDVKTAVGAGREAYQKARGGHTNGNSDAGGKKEDLVAEPSLGS